MNQRGMEATERADEQRHDRTFPPRFLPCAPGLGGERWVVVLLPLILALAGCGRTPTYSQPEPGFLRHDTAAVVRAIEAAGLPIADLRPRAIATVTPNPNLPQMPRVRAGGPPIEPMVEVEAYTFVIPSLGDKGGKIFVFDSGERLRAKQIWFARYPDLYPYVYVHQDVLLWLDSALPAAEAARYKAALETLR